MDKITRKISVSGGDLPKDAKYELNLTVDYSGCSRDELMKRAMSNDVIRVQSELRKQLPTVLTGYAKTGHEVKWDTIGTKTGGGVSYRQLLTNMGFNEKQVDEILNNPEKLASIVELLKEKLG